jgi:NAD(P)-dependent dehydrogenase (short-subunit alcohol dehydrogenase family)
LTFIPILLLSDADTSGSGKAIALRLARDGYDVCINDVEANKQGIDDVVNQVKSAGVNAVGAVGDVSDLSQVESVIQTSVKELGPLNTMWVELSSYLILFFLLVVSLEERWIA